MNVCVENIFVKKQAKLTTIFTKRVRGHLMDFIRPILFKIRAQSCQTIDPLKVI